MVHNIYLVGPMGAGKTTIGKQLARYLRKDFVDSDKVIEQVTGTSIPVIFEYEGEDGFREREAQTIDELTQLHNIILATGGGAVLLSENRQHLSTRGTVVYLKTTVEHQLKRTAKDTNRPLLQTKNPRERLEAILKERAPLYEELADIIVTTDTQPPKNVVKRILSELASLEPLPHDI